MTTAIPAPIQTLIDLFETSLADVRFADLDGQTLRRHALDVHATAEVVAAAQLALDSAREALQEKQDTLLQQAQRALAYARVYAESDEALSGRLEAISIPRAPRRSHTEDAPVVSASPKPSPRPRGRPRSAEVAAPAIQATMPHAE
jgi:hypothetical protein